MQSSKVKLTNDLMLLVYSKRRWAKRDGTILFTGSVDHNMWSCNIVH